MSYQNNSAAGATAHRSCSCRHLISEILDRKWDVSLAAWRRCWEEDKEEEQEEVTALFGAERWGRMRAGGGRLQHLSPCRTASGLWRSGQWRFCFRSGSSAKAPHAAPAGRRRRRQLFRLQVQQVHLKSAGTSAAAAAAGCSSAEIRRVFVLLTLDCAQDCSL